MTTYADRKRLGLILSAADRAEAFAIWAEIKKHGGSRARWERAERSPALYAAVCQIQNSGRIGMVPGYAHSAADSLEQFRRRGDIGLTTGGKIWKREA